VRALESEFAPGGRHADAWDAARAELDAAYPGVAADLAGLAPRVGLTPLGPDPDSGLWEFAHLASGTPPARDERGRLVLEERSCIVLVLLPGGRATLGAQRADPGGPNYDPLCDVDEPVHEVELSPFLMSKYELTQGQWLALTGENPSFYQPPSAFAATLLHPVENVDWETARTTLRRFGLCLPSEAQWEYAARGGTGTPYWTGLERDSLALARAANLADAAARRLGADWIAIDDWPELDDGWGGHAPVGSYAANAYGLHDVLGNLWEWCRDAYHERAAFEGRDPCHEPDGTRRTRVYRGGSYVSPASGLRVSDRDAHYAEMAVNTLGVRAAVVLEGN
jgi:formylglycine-generating enzyme required for sulfatase activity